MKGRKNGQKPKFTVGIGYVVAFRKGRTIEQISKFFKVTKNAVTVTLKKNGIDLQRETTKKIKVLESKISELQNKITSLEEKK